MNNKIVLYNLIDAISVQLCPIEDIRFWIQESLQI